MSTEDTAVTDEEREARENHYNMHARHFPMENCGDQRCVDTTRKLGLKARDDNGDSGE